MPTIINLRQDPFERLSNLHGETINNSSPAYLNGFMAREFWRFVVVLQVVAKAAQSAVEYPPMQDSSFLQPRRH